MGKLSSSKPGSGAHAGRVDFGAFEGPSAFQRELQRARQHLAKLEAEERLRTHQPLIANDHSSFDESPAFARVCNTLIWIIVAAPFVIALLAL
ncbi:MAG TPA: hypothetical protein VE567_08205, partial [Sphingomonas sp.]|nr:hypothetical protein [Sphingomonas sp.]